jgi:hypothetical protein
MNEFFKILNYLSYDKVSYSKLTDAEIKSINVYMLHRYLSMSSEYCVFVNEVQAIPNLSVEQVYNIYLSLLPKAKKYFKYTKAVSEKVDKDKVSKLSSLLEVSQREAKDYLTLLSNDDYKQILSSYGQNTDTGTPKRNKKQTGKRNKLPV